MDELNSDNGGGLVRLGLGTLDRLPADVKTPDYARSDLSPGIVHIGLGNFHRAHQAWYLHRLMNAGEAHDWAIIGAGVRAGDAAMRDRLLAQDCLTTLIELDPAGMSAEICGSMIDFLPVEEGNAPLIAQMADPRIRIVSLTVTEGGYFIDPATGQFDTVHADIRHDAVQPETPRTAFGAIVAAMKLRREAGTGAFTVQSCDNLRGNGAITREAVISLARLSDPDLADWIEANASFPDSMVDCIVPATGETELALVRSLGIDDTAPVTHENFRQWVIEDDFCAGRPEWDRIGATFSQDVHAYETMKLRILNGGHQLLGNPGELLGVETIADCMAHPLIGPFFRKVQTEEIVPHIHAVPDMTPEAYVDLIVRRFSNPRIVDKTRRVAFDGSSKRASQLHGSLRDGLAAGLPVEGLALADALWARMCAGTREDGSSIEPNDPFWQNLQQAATAARDRPRSWLQQKHIYGDLADEPRFADAFEAWLTRIWSEGTAAALQAYAGSAGDR